MAKKRPSIRMRRAAKNLLANGSKSIAKAMRDAGYSAKTARAPSKITKTKTWKELMDEYFPEDFVAAKHKELFNAAKLDHYVFPLNMTDEQIKELVESVSGCKLKKIEHGETQNRAYYWVPDNHARQAALDMAYKLRGTFKATEVKLTGLEKYKELPQDQLEQIINGAT